MKNFFTKHAFAINTVLFTFLAFLAYNYKLVLFPASALTDWLDYPLLVYIQHLNISALLQFDFTNYANTTMLYHTPNAMYFTDLLIPQSILALPFYVLAKDFIFAHNMGFFLVGLLNIISLYYFWTKNFINKYVTAAIVFLFTFSPYVFGMYYHYQMISYFCFFFSLGLLMRKTTYKSLFFAGFLAGLQFLSGAYLGIFLITTIALWYVWKIYLQILLPKKIPKLEKFKIIVKEIFFASLGFIFSAGYFLLKFIQTKSMYDISRSAEEYVNNAFQLTDFFFNPYKSFWTTEFFHKINIYNHRLGDETFSFGFILSAVILFSLFTYYKEKKTKSEKRITGFFVLLTLWGLIAAIGPRLTINGNYLATPLPYLLPLKLTPFFDAISVPARWFFLFQIGIFFFLGKGLEILYKRYRSNQIVLATLVFICVYFIEIVPIQHRTDIQNYSDTTYSYLSQNCSKTDVLLEYPFAPEQPKTHVYVTLSYWTKMLLNNMYYECLLVNGYSGYQAEHTRQFYEAYSNAIETKDAKQIEELLNNKSVTYIKYNKNFMLEDSIKSVMLTTTQNQHQVLYENNDYMLVQVK